jgi:hypothetical protein
MVETFFVFYILGKLMSYIEPSPLAPTPILEVCYEEVIETSKDKLTKIYVPYRCVGSRSD